MFQPTVRRSYLFELQLTTLAAGAQLNLTLAPQTLLNAKILGLKCYTASDLGFSPNQNAVVTTAGATNIGVTLIDQKSDQRIFSAAYLDFRPANNAGAVRQFEPFIANWSKSYIQLFGVTGLTVGQSLIFEVIYEL